MNDNIKEIEALKYHKNCKNKYCEAYFAGIDDAIERIRQQESRRANLEEYAITVRSTVDDMPHVAGKGLVFKLRYLEYENDEFGCSTGPLALEDVICTPAKLEEVPVEEVRLAIAKAWAELPRDAFPIGVRGNVKKWAIAAFDALKQAGFAIVKRV